MGRGASIKSLLSFNAGEWSPKLDARIDLKKYDSACLQLQNFTLLPYGGAVRRPGTQYIAEVKDSTKATRLVDFEFSTTTTFTIEMGDLYMRFFSNGVQVLSGGSPYEIVTVFTESELFEVKKVQINDIMYMVHPDHPVQKLTRLADDNWTIAEVVFDEPALLDENITTTTLDCSATTGTGKTLTSSVAQFYPGHVGSYWQVRHLRDGSSVERALTSDGSTSSTFKVKGEWNLRTYGYWRGTVDLERSVDAGATWSVIRQFLGEWDRNVDAEGDEDDEVYLRVTMSNHSSTGIPTGATEDGRVVLEAVDAFVGGIVKVTAVPTGAGPFTTCTVDVIDDLEDTVATIYWSEGAWSDYRGHPRAATIFEQRMIYAGTGQDKGNPQTFWGSVTGDYENFRMGTEDADGFSYTLGAQEANAILWMVAQNQLIIGTTGGEWMATGGVSGEPITPTAVQVRRQSTYGSADIQGRVINEVVMFLQRNGRKMREMAFSFERDGYISPDMTLLAEHITKGGVVQMAYQQQPDSIVWCVTGDGNLIGMTYERSQEVVGWHRHVTDGTIESVSTVYGSGNDEIWLIVNRTIGGATKRYVERFNPTEWTNKEDAFFVDSGITLGPGDTGGITNITNASPAVVTSAGHSVVDGDLLRITSVIAPESINGTRYVAKNPTANTFELYEEDGTTPFDMREATVFVASGAVAVSPNYVLTVLAHNFVAGDQVYVQEGIDDPEPVTVVSVTTTTVTITTEGLGPVSNYTNASIYLRLGSDAYTAGGIYEVVLATLTGLSHLEGESVQILVDGAAYAPDQVVSGGQVSIDPPAATIHVGLPFESILQPMRLDSDPGLGPSQGMEKQVREIVARFQNTLGCKYGDGVDFYNLPFRDTIDEMDDSPDLFSGDKQIDFDGDFDRETPVIIKQVLPLPMTILGLFIKYRVTGK